MANEGLYTGRHTSLTMGWRNTTIDLLIFIVIFLSTYLHFYHGLEQLPYVLVVFALGLSLFRTRIIEAMP